MGRDTRTVIIAAIVMCGAAFAAGAPRIVAFLGVGAMQAAAAETDSAPIAASPNSAPLALRGEATRVILAPPDLKGPTALAERLQKLSPQDQIYLVLGKLNITGATSIGYNVFFDLPAGATPDTKSPYYVGNFNFFDAESGRRNALFNITELVRTLNHEGLLAEAATVTIVPTGQLEADAKPTIEKAVVIAVSQ